MRGRVAITGAGGQLAADMARALRGWELHLLTHADMDVANRTAVENALRGIRPAIVINTAAFHRVDECERRAGRSFAVNEAGAFYLALACREIGATLVHISTDYVFDGEKRRPYVETDWANPLNVYGLSKLAGEEAIRETLDRHLIIRTSGLYGAAGARAKGGNFVNLMLSRAAGGEPLRVVDDQRLSPTYTRHLAAKIVWLLENEAFGLMHVTNAGACSWYEFTRSILHHSGLSADLAPVSTRCTGALARRPAYSVLAHASLAALGADDMPSWQEALPEYLAEIVVNRGRSFAGGGRS